jgi:predicted Zn-dependent peptidase
VFVDFQEEIYHKELQPGLDFYYLQNQTNELFSLNYIIDMGKNNMKLLPIAVNYLPYLGTDKYSPSELQQEFFKLGLSMNVNTGSERSYVSISGLESSMEEAIELLEHVLNNAKADGEAYNEYVKGILKQRIDAKKNNSRILWGGMFNYGKYGPESPFTDIVSEDELVNTDPESLTAMLKEFCTYEHKIFYYGQKSSQEVEKIIGMHHKLPEILTPCTEPKKYEELAAKGNKVYFTNYDMTQANILFLTRGQEFDKNLIPPARLFGEYFGGGLSSIVFQEIRESRALAYSAFASYAIASKPERHNFTYAFVGTQADKLKTATDAMLDLMNEMPQAQKQFDLAKESIIKNINTERIIKEDVFWTYLRNMDKGINYDIRKEVYEKVDAMSMEDLNAFFNEHIKGKKYTFMVLGSKDNVDMKVLGKLGSVEELTLENLFNY